MLYNDGLQWQLLTHADNNYSAHSIHHCLNDSQEYTSRCFHVLATPYYYGGSFKNIHVLFFYIVASNCPNSWIGFKNSCYSFVTQSYVVGYESGKLGWFRAQADCQLKRADLASLTTDEELDFVYRHTKNSDHQFWIGLRCNRFWTSPCWTWTSTEELNITHWNGTKPNQSLTRPCVVILKNSKYWNNTECGHKHAWICEMPKRTLTASQFWNFHDHSPLDKIFATGMSNFNLVYHT